jgi:peroxiredoxin
MKSLGKWRHVLGVALGIGLVVLVAWLSRDQVNPVVVGSEAPDFFTHDLEGAPRSLSDYRGKVVLLNIWATWCTPCKEEMPSMQRLYEEIRDEDFQVLAVSIDRVPPDHDPRNPLDGKLRAFADSLGLTFTILHDPSGQITTDYQSAGVPESFVLDREGIIVEKVSGPRPWDGPQGLELIRSVLEERPPSRQ